jgi:hypothetical protein
LEEEAEAAAVREQVRFQATGCWMDQESGLLAELATACVSSCFSYLTARLPEKKKIVSSAIDRI